MNPTRRLFALALVLIMALSGCSSNQATIIIVQPSPMPDGYAEAGLYSPGDESYYQASDASAGVTQPEVENQVITPAQPDNYADVNYGIVVGSDVIINPLNCAYRDVFAVNELVFESLVELDESLKPQPLLAERWSADGREWTFTLRSNIQFHNGQALTALDVVASYEKILENQSPRWYGLVSRLIEGMTAEDDQTLVVRSANRGYMLLYAMTFPIVQRNTLDDSLPMGTGPYWYTAYSAGASLRLEANPMWWRRASGYVQSINVLFYRNSQAALTGLDLGEIDTIATEYPTAALNRGLTDRTSIDFSTQSYECIVPNLESTKLSDINVRRAIMYAIDRTTLVDTVYAGMAQESEVPVIPGSWLYDPQSAQFNYNPERALQLLYNAGWYDRDQNGVLEKEINGVTLTMTLNLITYDKGNTATRSEAISLIAKQLSRVGISVTVETRTASEVKNAVERGNFDLALCSFELSEIPELSFLLASTGSSNYSSYDNVTMNGYLAAAYNAATADELESALSQVQLKVVEDLPILGLFFRSGVLVSTSGVSGLTGTRQYDVLRGMATATIG
ncbi:MAG: peptide ABC transporter substrate-binding protein [Clostridia bacterium]|nr:peptide ABC transporter substrate-binding protein [Clostridia bacterium]